MLRLSHMHELAVIMCRLLPQEKHFLTQHVFPRWFLFFFLSLGIINRQREIMRLQNELQKFCGKLIACFSLKWTPSFDCGVTRIFSSANMTNCQRKVTIKAKRTNSFWQNRARFVHPNKRKKTVWRNYFDNRRTIKLTASNRCAIFVYQVSNIKPFE